MKKKKNEYIIIEIKVSESDDKNSLSEACKMAINQIDINRYTEKFKFNGFTSFIKYGMAFFFRKKCLIEMKVNDENVKEYEDNVDDNKT